MEIRMTNPPSFAGVLAKTPGPQIFEKSYTDLTDKGGLIFGTGILAMIGAYFVGGLALLPGGLLVMGLAYTIMKVQRAVQKYRALQEHLKVLNEGPTLQVDAMSLAARLKQMSALPDENQRDEALMKLETEMGAQVNERTDYELNRAVSQIKRLWKGANFEMRSNNTSIWEKYSLTDEDGHEIIIL